MQEYMQTIVEAIRMSGEMSKAKTSAGLSVKLVPLTENDDTEAYLVTFKRIMALHGCRSAETGTISQNLQMRILRTERAY